MVFGQRLLETIPAFNKRVENESLPSFDLGGGIDGRMPCSERNWGTSREVSLKLPFLNFRK
jgi:hypothetical protein